MYCFTLLQSYNSPVLLNSMSPILEIFYSSLLTRDSHRQVQLILILFFYFPETGLVLSILPIPNARCSQTRVFLWLDYCNNTSVVSLIRSISTLLHTTALKMLPFYHFTCLQAYCDHRIVTYNLNYFRNVIKVIQIKVSELQNVQICK